MTVELRLPEKLEAQLRAQAAASGQDVESFVRQVVADSLLQGGVEERPVAESATDFAQRIEAWIALHPVLDHAIEDSRDSIYAGRGE